MEDSDIDLSEGEVLLGFIPGPCYLLDEFLVSLSLTLIRPVDRDKETPLEDPEVFGFSPLIGDHDVKLDLPVLKTQDPVVGFEQDPKLAQDVSWVPIKEKLSTPEYFVSFSAE